MSYFLSLKNLDWKFLKLLLLIMKILKVNYLMILKVLLMKIMRYIIKKKGWKTYCFFIFGFYFIIKTEILKERNVVNDYKDL